MITRIVSMQSLIHHKAHKWHLMSANWLVDFEPTVIRTTCCASAWKRTMTVVHNKTRQHRTRGRNDEVLPSQQSSAPCDCTCVMWINFSHSSATQHLCCRRTCSTSVRVHALSPIFAESASKKTTKACVCTFFFIASESSPHWQVVPRTRTQLQVRALHSVAFWRIVIPLVQELISSLGKPRSCSRTDQKVGMMAFSSFERERNIPTFERFLLRVTPERDHRARNGKRATALWRLATLWTAECNCGDVRFWVARSAVCLLRCCWDRGLQEATRAVGMQVLGLLWVVVTTVLGRQCAWERRCLVCGGPFRRPLWVAVSMRWSGCLFCFEWPVRCPACRSVGKATELLCQFNKRQSRDVWTWTKTSRIQALNVQTHFFFFSFPCIFHPLASVPQHIFCLHLCFFCLIVFDWCWHCIFVFLFCFVFCHDFPSMFIFECLLSLHWPFVYPLIHFVPLHLNFFGGFLGACASLVFPCQFFKLSSNQRVCWFTSSFSKLCLKTFSQPLVFQKSVTHFLNTFTTPCWTC